MREIRQNKFAFESKFKRLNGDEKKAGNLERTSVEEEPKEVRTKTEKQNSERIPLVTPRMKKNHKRTKYYPSSLNCGKDTQNTCTRKDPRFHGSRHKT